MFLSDYQGLGESPEQALGGRDFNILNGFGSTDGFKAFAEEERGKSFLPTRAIEEIDAVATMVFRDNMALVDDIRAAGLSRNIGFGQVLSSYHKATDLTRPRVVLDPGSIKDEDRMELTRVPVPVPVYIKGFRLSRRELATSEGMSQVQDHIERATRGIAEEMEIVAFDGADVSTEGATLLGVANHPDRNTFAGSTWTTVANIVPNVLSAIAANEADNAFGPYGLYTHKDQFAEMRAVIDATNQQTAIDRVEDYREITNVKRSLAVTAGTAILIQLARNTVDMVIGMDLTVMPWSQPNNQTEHWVVMMAMALRVKSDAVLQSGICELTGI